MADPLDSDAPPEAADGPDAGKILPPAAARALAEAEMRRVAYAEQQQRLPKEVGGRKGPEPVRYGDWEVKGIASDF